MIGGRREADDFHSIESRRPRPARPPFQKWGGCGSCDEDARRNRGGRLRRHPALRAGIHGLGPKDIRAHLIGDLLVVRLQGVLTAAEQQLVKALAAAKGRDLLKQVRTHLIETARPLLEAMVQEATGVKIVSLHHDISTATGEEVILFTLADSPLFREAKKK